MCGTAWCTAGQDSPALLVNLQTAAPCTLCSVPTVHSFTQHALHHSHLSTQVQQPFNTPCRDKAPPGITALREGSAEALWHAASCSVCEGIRGTQHPDGCQCQRLGPPKRMSMKLLPSDWCSLFTCTCITTSAEGLAPSKLSDTPWQRAASILHLQQLLYLPQNCWCMLPYSFGPSGDE